MADISDQMAGLNLVTNNSIPVPNAPGSAGSPMIVQTNLFPVRINGDKSRTVYRYDITLFATSKSVEDIFENGVSPILFTKKTLNDVVATNGRSRSGAALTLFVKKNRDVFPSDVVLYYDQVSILFTSGPLQSSIEWTDQIGLTEEEAQGPLIGFKRIGITIKMCENVGQTTLNRYTHSSNSLEDIIKDRSLLQFMEIVIAQSALSQPERFLVFEAGKTFFRRPMKEELPKHEYADLPDGKQLMVGCTKSVVVVEGPKGRGRTNLGLIVDAKKVAFHKPMSAATKASLTLNGFNFASDCNALQLEKLNIVFTGVMVSPTTSESQRSYRVTHVAYNSHRVVNIKEENISVRDYFKKKHGITLQAPLAPLLCIQSKQEIYFPMEVCMVLPDQRVQVMQQTGEQSRQTTRECAVLPGRRQDLIMTNVYAQGTFDSENNFLNKAGVQVIGPTPVQVPGRYLPKPRIMYRQGQCVAVDETKCSWRLPNNTPYLVPAVVGIWCVYSYGYRPFRQLNDFAASMTRACQNKGMRIQNPNETGFCLEGKMEALFQYLKQNGCEFLLFVMDDQVMAQDELKLYERKYEILTQNVKQTTARDIVEKNKSATIENLCNKINIKGGGINFTIGCQRGRFLYNRKTVVIGIGASNPPPSTKIDNGKNVIPVPSVIGFSANICAEPESFAGDFEIVEPRNERAQLIGANIVTRVLELWKKSGFPNPEKMIIYRAGLSSGSFENVVNIDVPQIQEVFKNLDLSNIKLTYIICVKDQAMRLFPTQITGTRGPEQNIKSGLVVDQVATNPMLRQFFLNSHVTLQGTAKTPIYTILFDQNDYSMDEIQEFTFNLSYDHQIVNLPISYPAPLYIAIRYAERGRRIFVQDVKSESSSTDSTNDLHRANERLSYKGSAFERVRLNA